MKLTIRITFILLLIKGFSLLGKEGDYEYYKETRYDKFGQITYIYESIYIPPVTQEIDGATVFFSPGYFAERFEQPEKMDENLPLTQILTDKWENYKWDTDIDDESWRKEIKSLPEQMTQSFSSLSNFLGGLGSMNSHLYRTCTKKILPKMDDFADEVHKFDKTFKKLRKNVYGADKGRDLIKRIEARKKAISAAEILYKEKKNYAKWLKKWNNGLCGRHVNKFDNINKFTDQATEYRKYKDRRKEDLKRLEKGFSRKSMNIKIYLMILKENETSLMKQ